MVTSASYWLFASLGVVVYWLLPGRLRAPFLALLSIAFVALLDPTGCAVFLLWALAFYLLAPLTRRSERRFWLPVMIVAILGYLAVLKYVPPLVRGEQDSAWSELAAPIGLSYFTFKLIHYVVEVARSNIRERPFWTYLSYVFLFPTFTAGPIERFDHFLSHRAERLTRAAWVEGATRIVHGLVKKFVLVEIVLEQLVPNFSGAGSAIGTTLGAWQYCGTKFLTVYLDFSAYSDIAIGTSLLFGARIMENFDRPLLATSLAEFWQRWHMTLVGWCRAYVYLPTIGLTRNPYLAVYALCLSVGLWHAGSLPYVVWGLYHATGVVVHQTWKRTCRKRKWSFTNGWAWRIVSRVLTILFVSSSFAFTGHDLFGGRFETLPDVAALQLLLRLFARLFFLEVG